MLRILAFAQGLYYVATGLWPMFSMTTFEAVTGEKTDDWLVKTVGALVLVIGVVLLASLRRREPGFEVILLGAGACIAFAAVDVVFATSGTIAKIYLLDAALEGALLIAWLIAAATRKRWSGSLAQDDLGRARAIGRR